MSSRAALAAAVLAIAGCGRSANPPESDRWISAFNDPARPYPERVAALKKLGTLREEDRTVFPRIREALRAELSRWNGLRLSDAEEEAVVEALGWLAEAGDAETRIQMELHFDRVTVKGKRLSDALLVAIALNLAKYPENASAGRTLWAALEDPEEHPAVRAAALKSLSAFHPDDLPDRVLALAPADGDAWLRDLQQDLR